MPQSPFHRRLLLTVALLGASVAAWAQPQPPKPQPQAQQQKPQYARPQRPPSQQQSQSHRDRQLSESVRRAERNGQVLSAEQIQSDGRDVNRVKIIDNRGRVRVYWDDPSQPQKGRDGRQDGGKQRQAPPRTRSDDDGDPTL
jgi:hypothetical protein